MRSKKKRQQSQHKHRLVSDRFLVCLRWMSSNQVPKNQVSKILKATNPIFSHLLNFVHNNKGFSLKKKSFPFRQQQQVATFFLCIKSQISTGFYYVFIQYNLIKQPQKKINQVLSKPCPLGYSFHFFFSISEISIFHHPGRRVH